MTEILTKIKLKKDYHNDKSNLVKTPKYLEKINL